MSTLVKIIDSKHIEQTWSFVNAEGVEMYDLHGEVYTTEQMKTMGWKPFEKTAEKPDKFNIYSPVYTETESAVELSGWDLEPPHVDVRLLATLLVIAAESNQLDDAVLAENPSYFILWQGNFTCLAGTIVQEIVGIGDDQEQRLYRSIHDIGEAYKDLKPSENPTLWTRIGNPAEEYPEWFEPKGAHDAYPIGAKVSHSGKQWVSNYDNNIWEPGVFGWEEV